MTTPPQRRRELEATIATMTRNAADAEAVGKHKSAARLRRRIVPFQAELDCLTKRRESPL